MNKINSIVTFVRKSLKVKGKSQHNGRGVYNMTFEEEVREKLDKLVIKWKEQGLLESVEEKEDGGIGIVFKKEVVNCPSYRTFYVKGLRGGVFFSMSLK